MAIFFLHGENSFQSRQKLHELIDAFVSKFKGNFFVIDADTFRATDVALHLKIQGLFSTRKLIVLTNLLTELQAKEQKTIEPLLDLAQYDTLIFYERARIPQHNALAKKMQQMSRIKGKAYYPEFTEPNYAQKQKWIVSMLSEKEKRIETTALNNLIAACKNSWQLYNETQKLLSWPENIITDVLIRQMVQPSFDDSIFAFTDALVHKNKKETFALLNKHLATGQEPLYMLAMIARHIKLLLKVKTALLDHKNISSKALADAIHEHPYAVSKALPAAQKSNTNSLIFAYMSLRTTDKKLKSTRISAKTLLSKCVYDIMHESHSLYG